MILVQASPQLILSLRGLLQSAVAMPSLSAPQCRAPRSACWSGSIEAPLPIATGIDSGRLRLQRRCSETSHHTSAIVSVAVGVLMEVGVEDPVPALNVPPVSRQLQEGFWGCAEAGEKEVCGVERLAVAGSCGGHLNEPACAGPGLTDVLRRFFRSQSPGDVTTMADLVILWQKRDLAFPLESTRDSQHRIQRFTTSSSRLMSRQG